MGKNDLVYECTFYGNKPDSLGCLYFHGKDLPVKSPDLLFFCMYTLKVLTDKKISLDTATELKNSLHFENGPEVFVQEFKAGKNPLGITVTDYRGFARISISSSMLFLKKLHFRWGHIGFGFFRNKGKFNRCSAASVYGLICTFHKLFGEEPEILELINRAAGKIAAMEFGEELNAKNCRKKAADLYISLTGDNSPMLKESFGR